MKDTNRMYSNMMASYGQYNRMARYSDYQEMETMAECAAALDIYSEETCTKDENGKVIKVESSNSQIRRALEDLFYDVLNIEFESSVWIRNTCKYGDQFLLIDHHPDYGVLGLFPLPVNEVEREEGYDKNDPTAYRYRWITQGNRALEKWQILHFRMPGNDNFLPYGSSVLEPARRVWRQLVLMEDAVMVYRIVRSPERRVFYIGIGNIAPNDVEKYMETARTKLKRSQVVNADTGRVDLRYNPLSVDEDYYIPTRGEGDGTRIESLPGGQFTGDIEDLQYIQNKLFAALKIPKSYLGYEGDVGSKSTLSQEDVRFSRTIAKIQRSFIQEMNKIAIIHLYSMGYRGDEIVNFLLSMANPSSIAELQKLELWRTKFEVASMSKEGDFDRYFMYKTIFRLSDEEIEGIEEGKRRDRLFDMELESLQLSGQEAPVAAEPVADIPVDNTASVSAPEPGLPPPPGEEAGAAAPEQITAGKDPYKQVAAPNSLIEPFGHGNNHDQNKQSDLTAYSSTRIKKTALDPKRGYSELMRTIRAPFGEEVEKDNVDEQVFNSRVNQLRRFAEELEEAVPLRSKKKIL